MKFDNITSVGFWVGLALIVLAWIKAVPLLYGWVGLGIALPSFIVEAIKKNLASSSTDESSEGRPKN